MEDLIIRECRIVDIDAVYELQIKWENENITYGFNAAKIDYLISKLGKYFLVAEYKDKIVGFAYGTVHVAKDMSIFNDGEKYIEIDDIYINPEHRNSGAGGILVDILLDIAKANNIERSLIYSATKDLDSVVNFYKKHEFKTWYVQMFK